MTEPCTLYARWAPTYTVTFDAGEGYFEIDDVGTPAKTCVQKIARHSSLSGEAIAYSLYNDNRDRELLGWSLTLGGELVADPSFDHFYTPSGDCTLYAVWTKECTITYNTNGGYYRIESENDGYKDKDYAQTWDVPCLIGERKVFHPGEYLRSDDPSLVFTGWSTDETGSYVFKDDLYDINATFMNGGLKGDTTLYAIWKKSDCSVTIDINGSFLNDSFFSEQIELDAFSGRELRFDTYDLIYPDNKGLVGFSLSKDSHTVVTEHGEDGADGFSGQYYYTPSKSCTLYAVWGINVRLSLMQTADILETACMITGVTGSMRHTDVLWLARCR